MQRTKVASAIADVVAAGSVASILASLDKALLPAAPVEFGLTKTHGVDIGKARLAANQAALEVLARVTADPSSITEADKDALRKYSGKGGIGGSIDEYYTPQYVAEGVWDMMAAQGAGPGNYLEPSAGIGVFNGTKPAGAIMTASELDATSSQINQLLHPEDHVRHAAFEQLASETEDNTWDGAVGNVPFGDTRGMNGAHDPEYSHIKYVDQYFITRMIDKVKPGALISVVVPPRIISRASWSKWRHAISLKAEFLGAHRLPSGTFDANGTDTVTDILLLRKHPADMAELINSRKSSDLKAANVLWDTWIKGKWFESAEGRRFIMGEQTTTGTGRFARMVVEKGNLTNQGIKERLAQRFDSRIDWAALELAEPSSPTYAEGDERQINGRWHRLTAGEWELIKPAGGDGDEISQETYGAASVSQLRSVLSDNPQAVLELTLPQIMAVERDYPRFLDQRVHEAIKLAKMADPKHRERIIRGTLIGDRIRTMAAVFTETGKFPVEEAAQIRSLISNEIARFGVAAADKTLATLKTGNAAGAWQAFYAATDPTGELSDLLQGKADRGNVRAYDDEDAYQVVSFLFGQLGLNPVDLDDFAEHYNGSVPMTLEALAKVDGVAITPDGMLAPMDRATSGDVAKKSDRLLLAMVSGTDQAIIDNYQRQLAEIDRKRPHTGVDAIDMTMLGRWLPRRYVSEFLRSQGYAGLRYGKVITVDGEMELDESYDGEDGTWYGYDSDGQGGKLKGRSNEQFERQLEHYLNDLPVRGAGLEGAAVHMSRIKSLEEQFGTWLRQHDDCDSLVKLYNDTFNGYVPPEHSDAPLELTGLNAELTPFDYQNQAVRRLSEDGRGILGFGTGLGKTTTALLLDAYNKQNGRSKRSAVVVPKAVEENWYHEAVATYGRAYVDQNMLFVGIEPVRNKDGDVEQTPVLDDEGEIKLNKHGQPLTRDKLRTLSGDEVITRINMIPHTAKGTVLISKERFATLPLRAETVIDHVDTMMAAGLRSGLIEGEAKNYREAKKKEKFKEKHSDTGTKKAMNLPYFEDCGFDSVIVDEGHNYRNTYEVGRQASQLAHLPKPKSAQTAMDMQMKMAWLQRKYEGRGCYMLTATPTVNSPVDVFNMLSHIITPEEWGKYGIADVNDFIKVFGETDNVMVQKLSGEVESRQGLIGFRNLSGLRSLFHRYVNFKTAKDVSKTVTIPDLEEENVAVDMSERQQQIYEELRQRAERLSNGEQDKDEPKDAVFAIIADMDRVCTDMDLYDKTMTFLVPAEHATALRDLVNDLPEKVTRRVAATATTTDDTDDYADGSGSVTLTYTASAQITHEGNTLRLVVSDAYEAEVVKRLAKFGIKDTDVSHPMTPKYARLVANVKASYEAGGKQLIFVEDKRQHNKLRRLLAHHLDITPQQIGIINADTVDGKSDMKGADGKKLKDVEPIAAAYNEGRFRLLICNKKAEVGVNLHHGTTDIHHLTLPWTPASIKQRNGRGARVGAKQSKVRVWYYLGKGSFDEWRLETLKRKATWQDEILTVGGAERARNEDASDSADMGMLLAPDPEERQRRIEEAQRKAKERVEAAARKRANIDLHNYLKAQHDAATDVGALDAELAELRQEVPTLAASIEKTRERAERNSEEAATSSYSMKRFYQENAKEARKELAKLTSEYKVKSARLDGAERRKARLTKANDTIKRLRGEVERAIDTGSIQVSRDVLDHGAEFMTDGKTMIRKGRFYTLITGALVEVVSLQFDTKTFSGKLLYTAEKFASSKIGTVETYSLNFAREECSHTTDEIKLLQRLMQTVMIGQVAGLMTEAQFVQHMRAKRIDLGQSAGLLVRDGDSFAETAFYQLKLPQDADRVIYPNPSDTEKARLAKWLLEDRSRMREYGQTNAHIKAIFGDSYKLAIEEGYGKNAPAGVINQWAADTRAKFEALPEIIEEWQQIKAGVKTRLAYTWDNFASKEIPSEWDNRTAFSKAVDTVREAISNEIAKEREIQDAREAVRLGARIVWAKANLTDDKRAARLVWLRDHKTAATGFYAFEIIDKKQAPEGCPYVLEDGRFDLAAAVTDLAAIGAVELGSVTKQSTLSALLQDGQRKLGRYDCPLNAWIEARERARMEAEKAAMPVPEPEKPSPEELEKAEAATSAANTDDKIVSGVTIRVISMPASVKINRYRKADMSPGSIALHDPQGKSGRLFAVKDTLKSLYGAKFAVDASEECPDAWWFVPASTPIDNLINILGG